MQISLRSQLIAGTAAVVGASAIAMTPVTSAHLSLPAIQAPAAVQTALVAFSSPLAQLSETVIQSSAYLFNSDLDPADRPAGSIRLRDWNGRCPAASRLGPRGAGRLARGRRLLVGRSDPADHR